jgi:hypothetical protein
VGGDGALLSSRWLLRAIPADGFYERFPSKGQVERVARIHKELARAAEIEPAVRGGHRKAMFER